METVARLDRVNGLGKRVFRVGRVVFEGNPFLEAHCVNYFAEGDKVWAQEAIIRGSFFRPENGKLTMVCSGCGRTAEVL